MHAAASEDQLRTIVDAIPTLVWSARPDGSAEFFNRRWLDYTGLSAEQSREWGWTVVIHPDDRDSLLGYWRSLLASGEPGEIEARMRRVDGEYRWFLVRGSPLRDRSGQIVRWYGTNTDIQELKRAQEALRAREESFRIMVDSIPGLVYTMTPAGAIELVNRRILDYFGKALDELKDWATIDVVHPDDLPRVVASWSRAIESGGPHEVEQRLLGADGKYRWFQGRSLPVHDAEGCVIRWYGLLTDIEDIQSVKQALQASEQALRLIIDTIPGFVYTMAPSGEPELFNRRLLDYFGKRFEELRNWASTDAVHPDDLPRVMPVWSRAVESGEDYEVELRLRRADGMYRWFQLRSRAVRTADGRIVRWYGLVSDIEGRRRAERRLRRAIRARYEAALAERTRIARDMHDGLLQDITGIALQLGAVLPHVRTSPEPAADRLARILDSIQQASRAARQAVVAMREQSESANLVSAVQAEAQRLAAQASLALTTSVRGPVRLVPSVVRDVAVSIVHEAVTNVVKHADASVVRVSVSFSGKRLRLSVTDDGRGLTPPGDATIAAGHFGLVGMRERASSIGAALRVSSVPGTGTTLKLTVPLTG